MVTYRKDSARKHWHRPWPIRIALVLLGLVLTFAGLVGWSLEDVYGGDSNRQEYVIGHDAEIGRAFVYGDGGAVVYESTDIADAEAYVESQRGGRNHTVPILLLTGGALSVIFGISPSPRMREPKPATPTGLEVHA